MAEFDDENWIIYTTENSDLPDDDEMAIVFDEICIKWFGTNGCGLTKFNGSDWTVYGTSNSGLLSYWPSPIIIDKLGNKWIGDDGLVKFDATTWTSHNKKANLNRITLIF